MINQLFIKVLNMSLTASIIIIAVLVARVLLRKVPKVFSYCLWGVVLFRLLCPISFTAPFSLLGTWNNPPIIEGRMEYIPENIAYLEKPSVNLPIPVVNHKINASLPQGQEALVADPLEIVVSIGTWIWTIGMCNMLIFSVISLLRLKYRLKSASHERDNIYTTDHLSTPFVLGFVRPIIYLPSTLQKEEKECILLHEQIHIKRGDHIVKLISFIALCIHWFNPLVWLSFLLYGQDMEMSCDESVIRRMGSSVKKEYSSSLLSFASGKRIINCEPLAFGEGDTGKRIKNLLRYKKPSVLVFVVATLLCVLFVVIFAVNPIEKQNLSEISNEQNLGQNPSESLVEENTEDFLSMDEVILLFKENRLDRVDFLNYTNGVKDKDNSEGTLNYYVNFKLSYQGRDYILGVSYIKENDELDAIYLTQEDTGDSVLLFTDEPWRYTPITDIEQFLTMVNSISDWLTITLPKGYTLTDYNANIGIDGGALIEPRAYEIAGEWVESGLPEWTAAGVVSRIKNAQDFFVFDNGRIKEKYAYWNHTTEEKIEYLEGLDMPAILYHGNHDLYTAAELGKLEEQGVYIDAADSTSDYWYIYFVKEDSDVAYYLSLATNTFTKEQAIEIARTVRFLEQ